MNGQPRADQIVSEAHLHTSDSDCLERIERVPTGEFVDGQAVTVPSKGWWRCTYLADLERTAPWRGVYNLHEHGPAFAAHEVLTRCEFPA